MTGEVLGYEQHYLGTARVERFADVSTLRIMMAREEIQIGDRLVPAPPEQVVNYAPHPPDRPINGQIMRLNRDAAEAGRGWVVTIDKGAADGLDVGTVLAIYTVVDPIPDPRGPKGPWLIWRWLDPTTFYQSGAVRRGSRRAHRSRVRLPRVRSRVLRARPQHDGSGRGRRLRPEALSTRPLDPPPERGGRLSMKVDARTLAWVRLQVSGSRPAAAGRAAARVRQPAGGRRCDARRSGAKWSAPRPPRSTTAPDAARLETALAWLEDDAHGIIALDDPDYPACLLESPIRRPSSIAWGGASSWASPHSPSSAAATQRRRARPTRARSRTRWRMPGSRS